MWRPLALGLAALLASGMSVSKAAGPIPVSTLTIKGIYATRPQREPEIPIKGYVFSPANPQPQAQDLDSPDDTDRKADTVYRQIDGNWYLFELVH